LEITDRARLLALLACCCRSNSSRFQGFGRPLEGDSRRRLRGFFCFWVWKADARVARGGARLRGEARWTKRSSERLCGARFTPLRYVPLGSAEGGFCSNRGGNSRSSVSGRKCNAHAKQTISAVGSSLEMPVAEIVCLSFALRRFDARKLRPEERPPCGCRKGRAANLISWALGHNASRVA
jgi:hypothetical protein